ncbi:MAG: MFS transporter [Coriobacteriia bacterium]|nr:MFS transporter [Coriobacteriia bacterium]MCL2749628.1 MFS transporter [Coriobacteriia bacterium]
MAKKTLVTYENKMVAICMLCFGFAMFDRFAITNLSPFIMDDLGMTNTDLGLTMSVFALAWALSGFIGSMLSDLSANKKRFLGVLTLLSSVCAFSTGLANSFLILAVIRFFMGVLYGPTFPLAQAFAMAQSSPKRRGLNMGLISTTSMGVIANLIAPVLLVALCLAFGWRVTFFLTFIPGAIVAFLILRVLKEPDMTKIDGATASIAKPSLKESLVIFKNRNVLTSMAFSSFIMCWNIGVLTFAPLFLINVKGFDPSMMSYVMAAFGVGAVVWGIVVPSLSDRFGRKPIAILFTLLSIISPLGLLMFSSPVAIALCAFLGWSGSGVFALYQGAIIGESVDTKYASTAMSSVQMVGEIGGGVIGVAVAGMLADSFGLQAPMIFAAGCVIIATLVAFAYYETAPAVKAKKT